MDTSLNSKQILFVDDIPANILLLKDALSHYRISTAKNGEEALEVAESFDPPDLILLDIMMPKMDGYEVCQKLKSLENTREIPIIFLTAKNDEKSEAKGLELGAVDYVTKPFGVSILRSRVKIHLELKNTRETLKNQNEIFEFKIKDLEKKLAAHDFKGATESLTNLTEKLKAIN
jgi:putative two-component system response regulator